MFPFALLLAVSALTPDVRLEAEAAERVGLVVDTTRTGFSGEGYVTGFDTDQDTLRFRFDAAEGVYELRLAIAQSARIKGYEVRVDGRPRTGSFIGTQGAFLERTLGELWLAEGPHTVEVVKGGGTGFDVDYLLLSGVEYAPPAAPPAELADSQATASTRALFAFLRDQYGRKILSGQQDLGEIEYVRQVTGRVPAVGAFDLIEYSPSRIAHGANPAGASERWISWAGRDGIVTMMWHWNAPADLLDTQAQPWWRGFYTEATTFDLAAALADTTSERFRLLLRDIDAIAVQLDKFQEADVPLLWRPLHEASGGWFWWGARGAGPFVELWRLLYHRLVDHHGLHNLVWVYTHDDPAWYPGDAYVDVVSRDVYSGDPSYLMRAEWEEDQARFAGRKLLALSESGTLPDPEVITDFGVWWSWFAIWNGSFIRGIDPAYLRRVYESEQVLTRDELPDWRAWGTAVEAQASRPAPALALYPNPTAGPVTLLATLPEAADVRIEIFDLTGRRVQAYALGHRPAGALETRVDPGAGAGVYVVRLVAGRFSARRTVVVGS